ncbi:M23 family metallopeptidase [Brachybacterium hainanense]|uniref:Peptidoglycan DD-metalloendopeptidase family protein n=1 Tax=Brachybacterium hainanense TaxID=1541174 RepID=A0ABV6R8X7_9MICO
MRPLKVSAGTRRDSIVPAGAVKVGMLGALATATIAVPLASATAGGLEASVPLADAVSPAAAASTTPATVTPTDAPAVALPQISATVERTDAPAANRSTERTSPAEDVAAPEQSAEADAPEASGGEVVEAESRTVTDATTAALVADDSSASLTVDVPEPEVAELLAASPSSPGGYIKPVNAPITSDYGVRVHPVLGYVKGHEGTDFGAACGTPARAAKGGTVVAVEYNSSSGNRVKIDHGDGVTTGYYHLQGFNTTVGAVVEQGETIGYVGSTGRSTGCHLHFAKMDASGAYSDPMSLFE